MFLCLSPFTDSHTSSPFPVIFYIFFCLVLFIAFYWFFSCFFFFLFFSYHVIFSLSFIPKVSFFPAIESLPLSLSHQEISLHPNLTSFPTQHMVSPTLSFLMGPSSCSASEDTFALAETLFSHPALSPLALFTLQHRLSLTTCSQSAQGLDLGIFPQIIPNIFCW